MRPPLWLDDLWGGGAGIAGGGCRGLDISESCCIRLHPVLREAVSRRRESVLLYERGRWGLRSRPVGGGLKLPEAASVKSRGGTFRLKGVTLDHVMCGSGRRAKANLWVKHRNRTRVAPKPGHTLCSGNSLEGTCLLARGCPVQSRRESGPGFRTELENLVDSIKGEGSSGRTARLKVPMGQPGADCSVVVTKRGNARGARGAGHLHRDRKGQRATGRTRWFRLKAAAFNRWHEPDESRDSCPDL